ncbi:hypothetical protein RND81_07G030300 [Saponaria officinalis]|uniref:BHLH domain-containing protein n=1 Tax=Saponaria officinalis TaxID=3572 RepID=A0AAW1JK47_SAPOF
MNCGEYSENNNPNQENNNNNNSNQQIISLDSSQQTHNNNINNNLLVEMHMKQYQTSHVDPFYESISNTNTRAGMVFQDFPTIQPPQQPPITPWNLPQMNQYDPFMFPSSSSYGGLFTKRPSTTTSSSSLQFAYDALGPMLQPGPVPFGLQAELNKMTAQEIMDAKALAASKSHSEAERRRRERINNHLAKLRSLLPSTTKTDKASLLAEVIQHVKELRRQTSIIAETSQVPTETDELTVDPASDGQDGKFIIKASLCCDDRSDLLPDLIKALKSLRLRTLKAEITSVGGRVKNVLFVTQDPNKNDDDDDDDVDMSEPQCSIGSIHEALKVVMEKSNGLDESTSGNPKRQRTNGINIS